MVNNTLYCTIYLNYSTLQMHIIYRYEYIEWLQYVNFTIFVQQSTYGTISCLIYYWRSDTDIMGYIVVEL